MKAKRFCIVCNDEIKGGNQNTRICSNTKHILKCCKCEATKEIKTFKELGVGKFDNFDTNRINVLERNKDSVVFSVKDVVCSACKHKQPKSKEDILRRKEKWNETFKKNHGGLTRSQYMESIVCSECGEKKGRHKESCSKFKKSSECEFCGYSLQSRKHAKDCPLYKAPKVCPECGGKGGHHKKSCSSFEAPKNCCEYCGTPLGGYHKKWCKYFEKSDVCEYCGYSLRSNRHAKDCPLYDEDKARNIILKTRETNLRKFGYENKLKNPKIQKEMCRLASESENSPHRSKLNSKIENELKAAGFDTCLEYPVNGKYYDILCKNRKNNKSLLLEYNPTISHNSEHSYYWFVCKDKPRDDRGVSEGYHFNRFVNAVKSDNNNMNVINLFEDSYIDKLPVLCKKILGCYERIECNLSFENLDERTYRGFVSMNALNKRQEKQSIDGDLYCLKHNGIILCVVTARKDGRKLILRNFVESLYHNTECATEALFDNILDIAKRSSCTEIQLETENELGSYNFLLNCGFYIYREGKQRLLWANRDNIISDKELKKIGTKKYLSESNPRLYNNKESELTGDIEHDMHLFEYTKMYSCGFRIWKMNVQ